MGIDPKLVYDTLVNQTVELVLTAHPTEVNRRTILDKKKRIQEVLTEADAQRSSGPVSLYGQSLLNDCLNREISSIWQSDEVSRQKPTPQMEAERSTLVIETVLWKSVPSFLRKLNTTMKSVLGEEHALPLDSSPIKFASWMGGKFFLHVSGLYELCDAHFLLMCPYIFLARDTDITSVLFNRQAIGMEIRTLRPT